MIYQILGWLAVLFTPVAPAFFFGWRVYSAVWEMTQLNWLALVVGLCAAIGLEAIGIFAGHTAVDAWQAKQWGPAVVASIILLVYVVIGVWELQGTIGMVMFLIAPLGYVVLGLRDTMATHLHQADQDQQLQNQQKKVEADQKKEEAAQKLELDRLAKMKEIEQQAQEAEYQRKLHIAQLRLAHEEKLAEIESQKVIEQERRRLAELAEQKVTESFRTSGKEPAVTFTDWRKVPHSLKLQLAHLSPEEIQQKYPYLSERTARNWHKSAQELSQKMFSNGHG